MKAMPYRPIICKSETLHAQYIDFPDISVLYILRLVELLHAPASENWQAASIDAVVVCFVSWCISVHWIATARS
jgi:hypothetical protein